MSFPPFDSSAPAHSPSPRPVYIQQSQYAAYGQSQLGSLERGDMSQQLRYPPAPESSYLTQNGTYMTSSSFSPVAPQFPSQPQSYTITNSDAGGYATAASYRQHQPASGEPQSRDQAPDMRYPMPRQPAHSISLPAPQEPLEIVPSQQPQPRSASLRSGSNHGTRSNVVDSALALEKPFECDICHTRFARQHDCRRHRETHVVNASGEKPHHCVVCGKSFTRKDALKRHTNQKGCDGIGASSQSSSRSSRLSTSPQQRTGHVYPLGSLSHPYVSPHY